MQLLSSFFTSFNGWFKRLAFNSQEELSQRSKIILFVSLLQLFFIRSLLFLDPDFGWHLRMGQFILTNGIPQTDPLSYTMSSFPFIDHEWLTNVILARLYPLIGFTGLAFLAAFAVVTALFLVIPKKNSSWALIPLLLTAALILPFAGVRVQTITWLFMAFLLKIVLDESFWRRWRFLLPPLFLFWVNLHGGFAGGVGVLFLALAVKVWVDKSFWKEAFLFGILCLGATFINPYGPRIWEEIWRQGSDTSLRFSIVEWAPIFFSF